MFLDDLVQSEGRVVLLVIGFLKKAGRDGVPTYEARAAGRPYGSPPSQRTRPSANPSANAPCNSPASRDVIPISGEIGYEVSLPSRRDRSFGIARDKFHFAHETRKLRIAKFLEMISKIGRGKKKGRRFRPWR